MSGKKFFFESYQDSETIKSYLESLICGIDRGRIVLACDGEELALRLGGLLHLEVKGKKKGARNRLSFKMTWNEEKDLRPDQAGKSMDINS